MTMTGKEGMIDAAAAAAVEVMAIWYVPLIRNELQLIHQAPRRPPKTI